MSTARDLDDPLDEPIAEVREEIERSDGGSVFVSVPRLVLGALEDLRTIAQSVSYLPELARSLGSIEDRVQSLDDEVQKMRAAVESMGGEVKGMAGSVAPLETSLEELERTLHPLRRAAGKLRRAESDS